MFVANSAWYSWYYQPCIPSLLSTYHEWPEAEILPMHTQAMTSAGFFKKKMRRKLHLGLAEAASRTTRQGREWKVLEGNLHIRHHHPSLFVGEQTTLFCHSTRHYNSHPHPLLTLCVCVFVLLFLYLQSLSSRSWPSPSILSTHRELYAAFSLASPNHPPSQRLRLRPLFSPTRQTSPRRLFLMPQAPDS